MVSLLGSIYMGEGLLQILAKLAEKIPLLVLRRDGRTFPRVVVISEPQGGK